MDKINEWEHWISGIWWMNSNINISTEAVVTSWKRPLLALVYSRLQSYAWSHLRVDRHWKSNNLHLIWMLKNGQSQASVGKINPLDIKHINLYHVAPILKHRVNRKDQLVLISVTASAAVEQAVLRIWQHCQHYFLSSHSFHGKFKSNIITDLVYHHPLEWLLFLNFKCDCLSSRWFLSHRTSIWELW